MRDDAAGLIGALKDSGVEDNASTRSFASELLGRVPRQQAGPSQAQLQQRAAAAAVRKNRSYGLLDGTHPQQHPCRFQALPASVRCPHFAVVQSPASSSCRHQRQRKSHASSFPCHSTHSTRGMFSTEGSLCPPAVQVMMMMSPRRAHLAGQQQRQQQPCHPLQARSCAPSPHELLRTTRMTPR